jgi:copper chaperone NosL
MKRIAIALAVLGVLALGVALVVRGSGGLPDEPVPVAWDRETCGHCHMHVGDPRYAAQLVTEDGDVLVFDDVGCALDYLAQHRPRVHRLWFHGEGDRWIEAGEVAFLSAHTTPMGSGLVAVDAGTPGAKTLAEVRR